MSQSHFINMTVIVLASLISIPSFAASDCDESCQHQRTLRTVREKTIDSSFQSEQDANCPEGGADLVNLSKSLEGSLLSANQSLRQIEIAAAQASQAVFQDTKKCGSCRQKNLISSVSISRPKSPGFDQSCQSRPTESFEGLFRNKSESAAFVKSVLDGNNKEGQILRQSCPDPCSYYVYTAETQVGPTQTRVQLVVRCGQPRGGVFSKYIYSGALVHQWSCTK